MEMHGGFISGLVNLQRKHGHSVKSVTVSEDEIANQARDLQVEGLRAELAVVRTARCAAAWRTDQKSNSKIWMKPGGCASDIDVPNRSSRQAPPGSSPGQRLLSSPRTSAAPIYSLPDPRDRRGQPR